MQPVFDSVFSAAKLKLCFNTAFSAILSKQNCFIIKAFVFYFLKYQNRMFL
jgi:hypothetical protein